MPNAIEGLGPAALWKRFAELSRIPRGSKNERAAGDYVMRTARELGLESARDAAGNVVVRKSAARGRERAPSVCLQGHLDMVCEKRPHKQHDFTRDPITLVRQGEWLAADDTTLGADNGVAVATSLALMEDRSLEHGPLEFLFTVDEETGLTGANELQPGFVASRILMNLDSEELGALFVGCSGGRNTAGTWPLDRDPAPSGGAGFEVRVGGLRGGHSGLDIDRGRGNAIKILNRAVVALGELGARLVRIEAGRMRNAIPRDGVAMMVLPRARQADATAAIAALNDVIRAEWSSAEPDVSVTGQPARASGGVFKRALQKRLTRVIAALPHGVIRMSPDIAGLVQTSTNVAVIETLRNRVTITTSQRSSVASEIRDIADSVAAVLELGGAEVSASEGYPGWKPNLDSPILQTAIATWQEQHGTKPEIKAVHAGLECGIIGEKYPGMDMVSFGPTLEAVHSPDERIHIGSVGTFWEYLRGILKNVR